MNESTIDMSVFHTPLKRLSNKPIQFHEPHTHVPEPKLEQEELKPLNEIAIQLSKTKLLNKQKDLFDRSVAKKAVYYKPPSSSTTDNQFGIGKFLPPKISHQYPTMTEQMKKMISEDETTEPSPKSVPTGDWMNPVMKQALSRQTNKETELKNILRSVLAILAVIVVRNIISIEITDVSHLASLIIGLLVVNGVVSCMRLLRAEDQCLDLPLNNNQRRLLGLDILEDK